MVDLEISPAYVNVPVQLGKIRQHGNEAGVQLSRPEARTRFKLKHYTNKRNITVLTETFLGWLTLATCGSYCATPTINQVLDNYIYKYITYIHTYEGEEITLNLLHM